ncbi:Crp/Fnr family transcriptional regulator [Amycolatopsis pithecellobii]|uniref:Helix-turn-helix domain-containing protein n=1 Tax=Amycolatopsis pithecellobii TaxID=664692 RepID=A0A6N7Z1Y5_9PSEU|nr:Crp/Fnr family transcriptional regulator [Amycolatopsis pithecellobii]MTD52566.1 helix-turn-helix domain-containing protein [Amycolatopsis pithecellobii]
MKALASLSTAAQSAWNDSLLAQFPEHAAGLLADRAMPRHFASGEAIQHGAGGTPSLVFLIVDGLARVYVRSESGREMTVRYAARGELVGLPALAAGRSNPGVAIKVMIDTECVSLPASGLLRLAAHDAGVAWPIARYVAETLHRSEQLWSNNVFQQMPPRVAYHLLELCSRDGDGLVVHATQDEVARAVGSVREVVARTLREFAEAALIERGPRAIRLLDPAGLHRVASPPLS